jgi:hypothetical protein
MSTLLTYLGILPFLLFGFIAPLFSLKPPIDTQMAFYGYSLSIIAFLAGSHWGRQKEDPTIAISSNIITLLAWASLLLSPIFINLCHGLLFASLLMIEKKLLQSKKITPSYYQTRFFVSLIVIGLLIINGLFIIPSTTGFSYE